MTGTPGPFWPWRGSSALEGVFLALALVILVASLPIGWYLLRRRFGPETAGPLWPLLAFEVLAVGYALVVPPWQMPDEPQHMVNVEVTREAGIGAAERLLPFHTPNPHLVSVQKRVTADVVRSMRDNDAVRWLPEARGVLAAGIVPGPPELNHPPLYYAVAAQVAGPFGGAPLVARLGVLRLFGVALAGWIVWACGAAGRLLFRRRPLSETPAIIAVAIPTFVLFAGSVNNDILADLLAALLLVLLLAGVLERAPLARPAVWTAGVAVLLVAGALTKRTFVPLFAVALVAAVIRLRRRPRALLAALIVGELVLGTVVAAGGRPRLAVWHRATTVGSARCREGRDDGWAICLIPSSYQVSQKVPLVDLKELEDSDVRVGLWLRGSDATLAVNLDTESAPVAGTIEEATPAWRFVVLTGHVPASPKRLALSLTARGSGRVFVDDVSLSPFEPNQPGAYTDPTVDRPYPNDVTNGSGRSATLAAPSFLPGAVRRGVDGVVDSVDGLFRQPDAVVASAGIMARRAAQSFGSFWATVGWQVPIPLFPVWLQWLLAALVATALFGAFAAVLRRTLPAPVAALLAAALLAVAAGVVLQTVPPDEVEVVSGRYLFPSLVAFALVAAAGWRHMWPGSVRTFGTATRAGIVVLHSLFIAVLLVPFLVNGVRI